MIGCCEAVAHTEYIVTEQTPEGHRYIVKIVYCKNCGSTKATTSVRHIR